MRSTVRRTMTAFCVAVFSLSGVAMSAAPATAQTSPPSMRLDLKVDASTTLANLGQTVDVKGGSLSIDLYANGDISGTMTLPPASTTMKLAGLPLAQATFEMAPAGPVTGHFDLASGTMSTTASFNIKLPKLNIYGLPWWNLVRPSCGTATPVTVTMSGTVDMGAFLAQGGTFSGEYAIPRFKSCGLLTPAMNLVVPGPGNSFTANATL